MSEYTQNTREAEKTDKALTPEQMAERDFLAMCKARFKLASEAESKIRNDGLSDMKFLVGDQWDANVKQDRINQRKPCLTINRLQAIKSQVVNEQRAQRPEIKVNPVGSNADIDTAKTLQGVFRHIEVNSDAEIAYDNGFESMYASGKGYWEVCTDYIAGQKNFLQEIYIKPVKNRFTVYCDPSSISPTEDDAYWKFQVEDIPHAEYRLKYPKSKLASLSDLSSIGDENPGWADSETVRVAKYWYKDCKYRTLVQLEDGSVGFKDEVPKGSKIAAERPYLETAIRCTLINAVEILDAWDWPGRIGYIPLVPIIGEDFEVMGERYQYGGVRMAKDPQKAYNIWKTAMAEIVALAPKAPLIGYKGQFTDPKWANMNTVNHAYLELDVYDTQGKPFPAAPQRNTFEPPIQALAALSQGADQDLKAVTGIYEPSLGQQKTDQSGTAINKLQQQSQLTNLNYTDNLSRAIRHTARVILDIIPFIYDAPRIQRIINPDGTTSQVIVHAGRPDAADALKTAAIQKVFDVATGEYDVTISVGPSYQTRRQQAFAEQSQLVQAYPKLFDIAGDIVVGNSDLPGSQDIAARFKKTIPPNLLDGQDSDIATKLAQAQAENTQLKQVQVHIMQQNTQMMDAIKTEQAQQAAKIEIARVQAQAQITVAEIQKATQVSLAQIKSAQAAVADAHDAAHEIATTVHGIENPPVPVQPNGAGGGAMGNGTQPDAAQAVPQNGANGQ